MTLDVKLEEHKDLRMKKRSRGFMFSQKQMLCWFTCGAGDRSVTSEQR